MHKLVHAVSLVPLSVLAAVLYLGCAEPVNGRGCDLCTTSAVIKGTVRDSAAVPARAVMVYAAAFIDSCTGP